MPETIFALSCFALIGLGIWSHPLEKLSPLAMTRKLFWLRVLSRTVMFSLWCLAAGSLADSSGSAREPLEDDPTAQLREDWGR